MRAAHVGLWLAGLSTSPAMAAEGQWRYVGTPVLTFEYREKPALYMPTGVAVAEDGTVFVADGVNDRILVFASDGAYREEIHDIGGQTLSRPISLKVDPAGLLWIADTGNGRILVCNPDGALAREIRVPQAPEAPRPPDITDVALSPDGRYVWAIDNDGHRLVQFDVAADAFRFLGQVGEALGQYYYPFMLTVNAAGDVLVAEPVSGRVQIHDATGRAVGSLGTFGVDLGELYRPKGIAVDRDGNVWVADGVIGVIQVFEPTGTILDVVRDAAGAPLKLDMPCGLALDRSGNLYVAELTANRVRKFAVAVDLQAAVQLPKRRTRVGGSAQSHDCTVCHLEWIEPLAQGVSTPLMAPPQQPVESRPETCLSCHDGSVVDSRRRVWLEHGHRTDAVPPPTMNVPSFLPLDNGRIVCRTCHSAHGAGQPTGDIATAVFLRVPNKASELCASCHADKTRGREAGTHPTGGMPWAVPEVLLKAGARVGPNPRELTCQVCHTPHGAAHDHLLVLGTESNQLCLACHDQMRPGMFREGGRSEHPLSPVVNAEQATAVRDMGTMLGPDDRLICLSCHKLHHGKGERFLLADELTDGQMCLRCHDGKRAVLGTRHDLRESFPEERNRLGMTPHTGGPCSSCHLFHRYARAPEASPLDPGGGKCVTCHEAGRPAQTLVLGPVNHPTSGCTQCHDPHSEQYGRFLRNVGSVVCTTCHADHGGLRDGPHDLACTSASWPAVATATGDTCLACHRPHGSEETGLFRAGLAEGASGADAACLACHPGSAPHVESQVALLHPRDATRLSVAPDLPLSTNDDQKQLACRTCHDPHHTATGDAKLLRIEAGGTSQQLCFNCHTEVAHIGAIGHAAQVLRAAGLDVAVCGPCHRVHGQPATVEAHLLWPRQLAYSTEATQPARVVDRHCLTCHHAGGPAPPPAIATHPAAEMFNPGQPDSPGFLPLFNDEGQVDPKGSIACRTCHLTHGRSRPAPVPPGLGRITTRELRAREWHIRSIGSESVCTTCHGFDALRRFMYFHDPARRGGPIQGQ